MVVRGSKVFSSYGASAYPSANQATDSNPEHRRRNAGSSGPRNTHALELGSEAEGRSGAAGECNGSTDNTEQGIEVKGLREHDAKAVLQDCAKSCKSEKPDDLSSPLFDNPVAGVQPNRGEEADHQNRLENSVELDIQVPGPQDENSGGVGKSTNHRGRDIEMVKNRNTALEPLAQNHSERGEREGLHRVELHA